MRGRDALLWIARAVLGSPQRSALTALGMAVGIAAVGLLTSVGEGLRPYMRDSLSEFGTRSRRLRMNSPYSSGIA